MAERHVSRGDPNLGKRGFPSMAKGYRDYRREQYDTGYHALREEPRRVALTLACDRESRCALADRGCEEPLLLLFGGLGAVHQGRGQEPGREAVHAADQQGGLPD